MSDLRRGAGLNASAEAEAVFLGTFIGIARLLPSREVCIAGADSGGNG